MLKYKLQDLKFRIKCAWQRAVRGYDDRAVWNLDMWFLEYVPKILKDMANDRCGHPQDITDKKWDSILNKMIECFTEANEDTCSKVNKYQKEYDDMWENFTNEYGYFGDKIPQSKECEEEGLTQMFFPCSKEVKRKDWEQITKKFMAEDSRIDAYRDKRLKEGLELFTKYFWNLWD